MYKLSADEIEYQKYLVREKLLFDEIYKKRYAKYKMNKIKKERDEAVVRKNHEFIYK